MTEEISLGGDADGAELRSGLVTLVMAVVEILDDALEREAIRRMESGQLDEDEIERLGVQLERLAREISELERREGVEDDVEQLRQQLSTALDDAFDGLAEEEL